MSASSASEVDRLLSQSQAALQRRDAAEALRLALLARHSAPGEGRTHHGVALAHRVLGDFASAIEALDEALALDPYDFLALLSKGALLERMSGLRAAAPVYRNAIRIAPRPEDLPRSLTAPLDRARRVVDEEAEALEARLEAAIAPFAPRNEEALGRLKEAASILAGRQRAYVQEPLLLHYPRLPAIPFYARSRFPWFDKLEQSTGVIRAELEGALTTSSDGFRPYIQYPPGAPVNQWGELNHSPRWSAFFLWRDGVRQDEACALCPRTAALLEELPLAHQPGFAPTVTFSALQPHTRIPPHTGSTNTRLLVHLPLILPGPARFRVGNETRSWRIGEAWAFDDTIEHEAWNEADALRVILIFDIWNPELTEAEREAATALLKAKRAFEEQGR